MEALPLPLSRERESARPASLSSRNRPVRPSISARRSPLERELFGPERWLAKLELRAKIEQLVGDMWRHFGTGMRADPIDERADWDRYPGW